MPVITRSQHQLLGTRAGLCTTTLALKTPSPRNQNQKQKTSLNLPSDFWPCRNCSCKAGVFKRKDSCRTCSHSMADHQPGHNDPWHPSCTYVCKRENLVATLLQRVRQCGAVVIRATPFVGKTTLLKLLGNHIAHNELDLEPVFFNWLTKKKRNGIPYTTYLEGERKSWQSLNATIGERNPNARTIYLIDEAQDSYEEDDLWSSLKNRHVTRAQPLFVLVCLYGATGISATRNPDVESQARRMHCLQRVELRRTAPGVPSMLFQRDEIDFIANQFAILNSCKLDSGAVDYLFHTTEGHPGMVGALLNHMEDLWKNGLGRPKQLTADYVHKRIVQGQSSFIKYLSDWGRGVWSPWAEKFVIARLQADEYKCFTAQGIKKALLEVARQPYGLKRLQRNFDEFAFCHRMGLLHDEPSTNNGEETTFTFASPLHRRVAYYRLSASPEPDAILHGVTLQQVCRRAIARFSPTAFQARSSSGLGWGIPERAIQHELYCCLQLELCRLPILSEFSFEQDGRIDFYVYDQNWGIEVLQCGTRATIDEHVARFSKGGKYQKREIMNDYIILNFCPRNALIQMEFKDKKVQEHFFHVVVEPNELTAEFYRHDNALLESWSLSEGRQGLVMEDEVSNSLIDTSGTKMHSSSASSNELKMEIELEEMQREREEMQREMEREREKNRELQLQLEEKDLERTILQKGDRKRKR